MYDLWFSTTFMHLICVLLVDLILPARRIVRTVYGVDNSEGRFMIMLVMLLVFFVMNTKIL